MGIVDSLGCVYVLLMTWGDIDGTLPTAVPAHVDAPVRTWPAPAAERGIGCPAWGVAVRVTSTSPTRGA